MFESRAEKLGLTGSRSPKSMAARTKRQINTIREKIAKLSQPWEEIDCGLELEVAELLGHFDEFTRSIENTADWLLEEAEY